MDKFAKVITSFNKSIGLIYALKTFRYKLKMDFITEPLQGYRISII